MFCKKKFLKSIFFVICLTVTISAFVQVPGRWEGTAEVNERPLLVAFNISSAAGTENFSATMDVPAQGAKGVPCDEVKVEGDSLFASVKAVNRSLS